jgi:Group II intron, maturase-specific domain
MSEGFDFLGFRLQWKRKRGTHKWYVYTFIADRPFRSVKAKIRALTPRTSQQDLRAVLIRINQITRGWANYFKHAIAKRTFSQPTPAIHLVADRADDADPAPLEVEGRPSLAHQPHRPVAPHQRGRDRTVQPRGDTHQPVPLPGQPDPQPLDPGCLNQPMADTMESPLRGNTHGGFGERAWGNGPAARPASRPRPTQPYRGVRLADHGARYRDRAAFAAC